MLIKIKDIMEDHILTISPEKSVLHAAEYMKENNFGGIPVVAGSKLLGIITSRDIRMHHPNRLVADAMTKNVVCCTILDTIWDAAEMMRGNNIERLPVIEKGKIVGIVTKGNIAKYIGQMHDHLTGIGNSFFIYMISTRLLEEGNEICAILIDLDNFGILNKKYGHVNCDNCLKTIAGTLKESTASGMDYICRYGGDEFVIVTLRKLTEAQQLAAGIIDKIIAETEKTGIRVTASAGISGGKRKYTRRTVRQGKVVEGLLNKASLASTKAKERGLKCLTV